MELLGEWLNVDVVNFSEVCGSLFCCVCKICVVGSGRFVFSGGGSLRVCVFFLVYDRWNDLNWWWSLWVLDSDSLCSNWNFMLWNFNIGWILDLLVIWEWLLWDVDGDGSESDCDVISWFRCFYWLDFISQWRVEKLVNEFELIEFPFLLLSAKNDYFWNGDMSFDWNL